MVIYKVKVLSKRAHLCIYIVSAKDMFELCCKQLLKFFTKIIKYNGPRMVLCGTDDVILLMADISPKVVTCDFSLK